MQSQNLGLSNILSKQQHYLRLNNAPTLHFQHQPITHNDKKNNNHKLQLNHQNVSQKKFFKQKEYLQRKQLLEKSQRMRKQLLLQKIASKNYRYQLRQRDQKQNRKVAQMMHQVKKSKQHNSEKQDQEGADDMIKVLKSLQKQQQILTNPFKSHMKSQKPFNPGNDLQSIQKIYVKTQPKFNQHQYFSSTKGFSSSKNDTSSKINSPKNEFSNTTTQNMRKTFNVITKKERQQKQQKAGFKQIRMKGVKLPQLGTNLKDNNKSKEDIFQQNQDFQQKPQIDKIKEGLSIPTSNQPLISKKSKKPSPSTTQSSINPILKTYSIRYFGIQQPSQNFQQIKKNLLKALRKQFWQHDNLLENEEVLDLFENMLADEINV